MVSPPRDGGRKRRDRWRLAPTSFSGHAGRLAEGAVARRTIALSLLVVAAAGCPRGSPPAAASSARPAAPVESWYPADISLPAGVEYPCAVTALPQQLEGIPDEDRQYVDHVYALVIGVVREKQVLLGVLARGGDAAQAHAAYDTTTDDALVRLKAEPIPVGLDAFHQDVTGSIELHRAFFEQAVARRAAGATMEEVHRIPEGRQASQRLLAAWGAMEGRYGAWSPAVKDSIYHHLCALDLF